MKVSFSRKGFDSANGSQPNVILPDGTLLPFPIPDNTNIDSYERLFINGRSFFDIISELKPRTKISPDKDCHLDPDLRKDIKARKEGWMPAFGQADQSLSELKNRGFGIGDLFLFFGWFRQTEIVNGRLRYIKNAPDIHTIYGYMQVGSIIQAGDIIPEWLLEHPHASKILNGSNKDAIYLPKQSLSFAPNLPGASMLKFSQDLVLTAPGLSRSKWALPDFFKAIKIHHSPKQPDRDNYFLSAAIGQEMVWDANEESMQWIKTICSNIE